jgi:hypothetical protein
MSEPRFELLDSYARELDQESDLILPPASAAQVRRVGTSRRRRRLVALVVVLVALVLAVGGALVATLTSRVASPNWATTPATPASDASVTATPTTGPATTTVRVIPSSAIDRLLTFTVSTAVFTADIGMPRAFDPATTMSGDPSSTQCGEALNGSFVSGTRGVEYRRTGSAADGPDWGYAIAYADASAAKAATGSLTRALTVVCTPLDVPRTVAPRTDGVEVLVYDVAAPTENGAKSVYVIRDRNVVVYHVDGLGLDANAVATAISARLNLVATTATGPTSPRSTTSASASTSVGAVVTLPMSLELKSAADINSVSWMTSGAKTFLVSELARTRAASGCADDYLIVNAYRGTDLISGSTAGCDSGAITWGNLAGTWKVLFAGQAVPSCTEVRSSGWTSTIPKDFPGGQCYDASGNVVAYTP